MVCKKRKVGETEVKRFARSIGKIIEARGGLARRAEKQYSVAVEDILLTRDRDPRRIERLLDGILDFYFDPSMLGLFKKLCRYYYGIDSIAAVSYVQTYRDMWDEDEGSVRKTR